MLLANMSAGRSKQNLKLWTSSRDLCLKGNFLTNKILLNFNNQGNTKFCTFFKEIVKILNYPLLSTKTLGSEIMFVQIQFSIHWETNKKMSKEFDQNIYTQGFNKNEAYLFLCLQSSSDQAGRSVAHAWPICSQQILNLAHLKNRPVQDCCMTPVFDLKKVWSC